MNEAKIDIAVNLLIVAGNPQIAIGLLQTPDMIVAHAIVFGQNDFNGVASYLKLVRETFNDIPQTADLGSRCTFRGNHDNVHESIPPSSAGLPRLAIARSQRGRNPVSTSVALHPSKQEPELRPLSFGRREVARRNGTLQAAFRSQHSHKKTRTVVAIINVTSGSGQTPANKFQ